MIANDNFLALINSPVRSIGARVELYEGSALADVYTQYYALKNFTVERVGEANKFFGFGICQKTNVHLIDKDRQFYITTADSFKHYLSVGNEFTSTFPEFFVTEVHRDENTGELSVTAYDALHKAAAHTVAELGLTAYTIKEFTEACVTLLGLSGLILPAEASSFDTNYETGANFEGTETIREALNDVAEVTQTIYYIDNNNRLVFKRLDKSGAAVLTIDKSKYFTLDSGTNRRLATVCHATELGDNVSASTTETGSTQYIRDNAFWELREDIASLVDAALAMVGGFTINQFVCDWRGNPLLEIGDKINLTTKDNNTVTSYVLDDVITYDGTLKQQTQWSYTDDEAETATNPTSIGEAINKTYARVDKVNKEIDLVASETTLNSEAISSLEINTENISASVQQIEENTNSALEGIGTDISTLTSRVEAKMSAEDVTLQIQTELANGVDKVTTSTGFTFNEEGLTVSKTGSEMTTQITEDGMVVNRDNEAVLTANNVGVNAVNLHATTYLIIGNNSRFEDYGDRTGCFWIGN